MAAWPEFEFDSEFESATEIPNMASQQVELAEAYCRATKAIHTHRTSFLALKPQNQRTQLIATAKELAKLVSAKDKAHYRLNRATAPNCPPFADKSRPPFAVKSQPPKVKQPPAAKRQPPNVAPHLSQPLQLPFQLLWPPDSNPQPRDQPPKMQPSAVKQPLKSGVQPNKQPPWQSAKKSQPQPPNMARDQSRSSNVQSPSVGVQSQRQPPAANQPRVTQPRCSIIQPPDLPPDPDPERRVSKEDWGQGSIDPG